MADLILITGGARSGKSAFAERYAQAHGQRIAYIATAQIFDEEMRYRVALHQKRRPSTWQTYEAPFAAEQAIREAAQMHDLLLFDCVTIYLSNLLCGFSEQELADEAAVYAQSHEAVQKLIEAAQDSAATCLFVTNEVGAGLVPENQLGRIFRDVAGLANQELARVASAVYLTVAGIPVNIKKLGEAIL